MSENEDGRPDGQQQEDMIPRSEAQRAFEARDQAKIRARALEEEIAALKATSNEEPKKKPPDGGGDSEPPTWAKALIEQQQKLQDRLDAEVKAKAKGLVVEKVLSRVPEGMRETASAVIDGLVARGDLSLDGEDTNAVADAAAKALQSSHGSLFATAGSGASAIQVGPDGKVSWDEVQNSSQVPAGAWKDMPDEVFKRLTSGSGSGGGLRIRGGR